MGVWGSGLFENDYALDELGTTVFELLTSIENELEQTKYFPAHAITRVCCLAAIAKEIPEARGHLIRSQLRVMRDRLLTTFLSHAPTHDPEGNTLYFNAAQRVFNRMIALAPKEFEGQHPFIDIVTFKKPVIPKGQDIEEMVRTLADLCPWELWKLSDEALFWPDKKGLGAARKKLSALIKKYSRKQKA